MILGGNWQGARTSSLLSAAWKEGFFIPAFASRSGRFYLLADAEQPHAGDTRVFFHSHLQGTNGQQQFYWVYVPANSNRSVPSPGSQEAIFGFDQGDFVRRKAQRFVAFDKIGIPV